MIQSEILKLQRPEETKFEGTFDVDDPVDGGEAAPDGAADDVHEAGEVGPLTHGLAKNLSQKAPQSDLFDGMRLYQTLTRQ